MKLTFVFFFLLVVVFAGAATARADSVPIDPDMIVLDAEGCGSQGVGAIFSFSANALGGGGNTCPEAFRNDSGSNWTGLTVSIKFPQEPCAPPSVFASNLFLSSTCGFNSDTGIATMIFSGVGFGTIDGRQFSFPGIVTGADFFINLGEAGWPAGDDSRTMGPFTAVATVPEPASLVLLAVGLAAFGFLYRSRTSAREAA